MEIAFFIFFLAVLIFGGIWGWHAGNKRREALAALAREHGWDFHPGAGPDDHPLYTPFGCFRRGHGRHALNTFEGRVELCGRSCGFLMGEFVFKQTSQSGKTRSTRTYRFSYLVVAAPYAGTPDLAIRREHFFDKIAGALGFDDIDFESEEFSRRFHVKSGDRRFAYGVVHPRMMEFLMAEAASSFLPLELRRGVVCLTDGSRAWKVEDYPARLGWLRRFYDQWPDHLTSSLAAAESPAGHTPG